MTIGDHACLITLAEAMARTAARLAAVGARRARRDARLLTGLAAEVGTETLVAHPETLLSAAASARLEAMIARRVRGEPISRIAGRREFWSLSFRVTPDTLDPRPDSETVVEAALDWVVDRDRPLRILDFGTGTGCLLLALLDALPGAWGIGVDISPAAAAVAHENARALGLGDRAAFLVGDWGRALSGRFDLIVANPPYVPDAVIDGLAPAVAVFDPRQALAGGADGLDAYRALAPMLVDRLDPEGVAVLEVGAGQDEAVGTILTASGGHVQATRRDLAGIRRCLVVGLAGARAREKKACNPRFRD